MDNTKKGFSDKLLFIPNKKSDLIKQMISDSALSQSDLAEYLNCTVSSLRNKFSRDSFSLYDFIVICHVCGYSFSICNGSLDYDLDNAHDSLNIVCKNLHDIDEDDIDIDLVYEALDEADIAQESVDNYECTFDFSIENILSEEECTRIKAIETNKRNDKYNKIINGLSKEEQLTLFEMLKDNQQKN